jgi:hypothetical protein
MLAHHEELHLQITEIRADTKPLMMAKTFNQWSLLLHPLELCVVFVALRAA